MVSIPFEETQIQHFQINLLFLPYFNNSAGSSLKQVSFEAKRNTNWFDAFLVESFYNLFPPEFCENHQGFRYSNENCMLEGAFSHNFETLGYLWTKAIHMSKRPKTFYRYFSPECGIRCSLVWWQERLKWSLLKKTATPSSTRNSSWVSHICF